MGLTSDQRIALILEANDQASAVLAKVRAQLDATNGAGATGARTLGATADAATRVGNSEGGIHKAARAMSTLSFAADQARLGSQGAVMAVGNLATAALEASPLFAEWAIPIGAAVTLLGTMAVILGQIDESAKPTQRILDRLGKLDYEGSRAELQRLKGEMQRMADDVAQSASDSWLAKFNRMMSANLTTERGRDVALHGGIALGQLNEEGATVNAAQARVTELAAAERARFLTLQDQTSEMARQKGLALESSRAQLAVLRGTGTQVAQQRAAARASLESENAAVVAMFRRRNAQGDLVKLTDDEVSERARLLGLNQAAYRLSVDEIALKEVERAKDARFAANTSVATLQLQARNASQPELDALQQRIEYTQQLIAIQRAGYAPELAAYLTTQAAAIYKLRGEVTALDRARQNAQARADLHANSDNAGEQYTGRLEQIRLEREAAIKSGTDRVLAERRAQQQIKQLQRDSYTAMLGNLKGIEDATIHSHSRGLQAVGSAAQTFRRLAIGAEGAHSVVLALKEGAAAIGSAAIGDFRGAALHALSSVQYAAAAARAGQEALGGGGGNVGGGGGSSSAGTFEPRSGAQGGGDTNVFLITRDPYGRDSIQNAMYAINRAQVLGRPPIEVPPTNGLRVA